MNKIYPILPDDLKDKVILVDNENLKPLLEHSSKEVQESLKRIDEFKGLHDITHTKIKNRKFRKKNTHLIPKKKKRK